MKKSHLYLFLGLSLLILSTYSCSTNEDEAQNILIDYDEGIVSYKGEFDISMVDFKPKTIHNEQNNKLEATQQFDVINYSDSMVIHSEGEHIVFSDNADEREEIQRELQSREAPCDCQLWLSTREEECVFSAFVIGNCGDGQWQLTYNDNLVNPIIVNPTRVEYPKMGDGVYCISWVSPGCNLTRCRRIEDCKWVDCNCQVTIEQSPTDPCLLVACPNEDCLGNVSLIWTFPDGFQRHGFVDPETGCGYTRLRTDTEVCVEAASENNFDGRHLCKSNKQCITIDDCFVPCEPQFSINSNPIPFVDCYNNDKLLLGLDWNTSVGGNFCCCNQLTGTNNVGADWEYTLYNQNLEKLSFVIGGIFGVNTCGVNFSKNGRISHICSVNPGDQIFAEYEITLQLNGCPYNGPNPIIGRTPIYEVKSSDLIPCCI